MINIQKIYIKIESYGRGYENLVRHINEIPRSVWKYRLNKEEWTIHEILVHLADSEANAYIRCRKCIAENGEPVMTYDENKWASSLNYLDQDADLALENFRILRLRTYNLIKSLDHSAWENYYIHPESGKMGLIDWLDVYESHVDEHLEQIEKIYSQWVTREKH